MTVEEIYPSGDTRGGLPWNTSTMIDEFAPVRQGFGRHGSRPIERHTVSSGKGPMPLRGVSRRLSASRGQSISESIFDSEHAALRAALLSLARDGYHELNRSADNHSQPYSCGGLGKLLQRIEQLDERLACVSRTGAYSALGRSAQALLVDRVSSTP